MSSASQYTIPALSVNTSVPAVGNMQLDSAAVGKVTLSDDVSVQQCEHRLQSLSNVQPIVIQPRAAGAAQNDVKLMPRQAALKRPCLDNVEMKYCTPQLAAKYNTQSTTSRGRVIRCLVPISVSTHGTFRAAAATSVTRKGTGNDVNLYVHTYPYSEHIVSSSCAVEAIQQRRTSSDDSASSLSLDNAQLSNSAHSSIGNLSDTVTDVNSSPSLRIESVTSLADAAVIMTPDSADDSAVLRQSYSRGRECCFCDVRLASMPLLLEHFRHVHSIRNMFPTSGIHIRTCGYCLRSLKPDDELEAHLLSQHCGAWSNAYKCGNYGCHVSFVSKTKRKWHENSGCQHLPRCVRCSKTFSAKWGLRKHMTRPCQAKQMSRAKQDDNVNAAVTSRDSIPISERSERVITVQPSTVVMTSGSVDDSAIGRHQSYGRGRECCFCDVRLALLSSLFEHLRDVHSDMNMIPAPGIRIRTCGYCLRSLKPGDELEMHLITYHCGAYSNAYKCHNYGCGARFVSKTKLRWHEIGGCQHPPQCVRCAKTFSGKSGLKRHMTYHCHAMQMSCADEDDDVNTAFGSRDSMPISVRSERVVIIQPQLEDVKFESAASDVISAVQQDTGDINTTESLRNHYTIDNNDFTSRAITTATVTFEDSFGYNMRLQAAVAVSSSANIVERTTGAANMTMSRSRRVSGGCDAMPEVAGSTGNVSSGGSKRCCYCNLSCTDHQQLMTHLRQKHMLRYVREWQTDVGFVYACSFCNERRFASTAALVAHLCACHCSNSDGIDLSLLFARVR